MSNSSSVQLDVKDFTTEIFRTFDVVIALGILYHLDKPVEWLQQISKAIHGFLMIESHCAPEEDASLRLLDTSLAMLDKLQRVEVDGSGYEGHWYVERGERQKGGYA